MKGIAEKVMAKERPKWDKDKSHVDLWGEDYTT